MAHTPVLLPSLLLLEWEHKIPIFQFGATMTKCSEHLSHKFFYDNKLLFPSGKYLEM